MTDLKDVIQSQDGSDLFNTEKGILNMACWFTGPRIVELKARVVIFSRAIYGLWSKIIMMWSKIIMISSKITMILFYDDSFPGF